MDTNKKLSQQFLDCLTVERTEDNEQTAELLASNSPKQLSKSGLAVLGLDITNVRTSIGGSLIMELVSAQNSKSRKPKNKRLSKSKEESTDFNGIDTGDIKTGDIVKVDSYSQSEEKHQKSKRKLKHSSKKIDQEQFKEENLDVEGVIISVSEKKINVAVNIDHTTNRGAQLEEKIYQLYGSGCRIWIVKLSNEITYNRMESTMRKLSEMSLSQETQIMQLLLGESQFSPVKSFKIDHYYNSDLNSSQKKAIEFSMSNNLSIIHGPPGTGKTSTIVELVKQLITFKRSSTARSFSGRKASRILICGPSNISVDTILERLSDFISNNGGYDKLVRIGHPARILPQILKHSLDMIVEKNSHEVIRGIMEDMDSLTKKLRKVKHYKDRRELYQEMKDLKRDLRSSTRKGFSDSILNAEVVVATLHGSSSQQLVNCIRENGDLFDTLIIDEVSQSLEPSCWIPLIYHKSIKKIIIAGDNKQLSPTIKTKKNKKVAKLLATTMFDRLLKVQKRPENFVCFLNVQYRMNEKIMKFPSESLYNKRLVADSSVKDGIVKDLLNDRQAAGGSGENPNDNDDEDDIKEPIIWYDTEGGSFPEMSSNFDGSITPSRYNDGECLVVLKHVKSLLSRGVHQDEIGIITPYSAQVTKLRQLFRSGTLNFADDDDSDNEKKYIDEQSLLDKIEISTVDGFQGREKEIIILSLVRSNEKHNVGFLSDEKRLNVSITRCKKQLCVVGDFDTIGGSKIPFLKKWCDWCENNNVDIRYVDDAEIY
mgnify:CR=1 FL=1